MNATRPPWAGHWLESLRNVTLFGHVADERITQCMMVLQSLLKGRGLHVDIQPSSQWHSTEHEVSEQISDFIRGDADLVIAVGGDGTLLRAAHRIAEYSVPLLGINLGRLGFLTDVSPENLVDRVTRILEGDFIEDSRPLIEATLLTENAPPVQKLSLNDVVIQKSRNGRIVELDTSIDGRYVNTHRGDGLVVATATGSTAYALSCGGPIVMPDLDVWVVAPICPHTLSDTPLVSAAFREIEVTLNDRSGAVHVSCDGVALGLLDRADRLQIRKSNIKIRLLHPPDHDYFRLLRSKLRWGFGRGDK
jgi:NAD+ kinase